MDSVCFIFWVGAFLSIIAFSNLIIARVKLKQKCDPSGPKE
jgi:hypothetical protein